jgi:hypothetical protein
MPCSGCNEKTNEREVLPIHIYTYETNSKPGLPEAEATKTAADLKKAGSSKARRAAHTLLYAFTTNHR